jgi:hypothetical protein
MKANPPGSAKYKEKAAQDRIVWLHEMISGNQPIVGKGVCVEVMQGNFSGMQFEQQVGTAHISGRTASARVWASRRRQRGRERNERYTLLNNRLMDPPSSPGCRRERDFWRRRQAPQDVPKRRDLYAETQEPPSRSRKSRPKMGLSAGRLSTASFGGLRN